MTLTDPIGDMFSRIRNGQLRQLKTIDVPSSNFRLKILEVLKQEGFILNFFIEKLENNKKILKVDLKYYEGMPVIKEIKREYQNQGEGFIQGQQVFQKYKMV